EERVQPVQLELSQLELVLERLQPLRDVADAPLERPDLPRDRRDLVVQRGLLLPRLPDLVVQLGELGVDRVLLPVQIVGGSRRRGGESERQRKADEEPPRHPTSVSPAGRLPLPTGGAQCKSATPGATACRARPGRAARAARAPAPGSAAAPAGRSGREPARG